LGKVSHSLFILCYLCYLCFLLFRFLQLMSDESRKVIIIADDLSGAAELAGIAFAHGLSAEVQRQFEPRTDAQMIAIDTDSRHLRPEIAADRVRRFAEQVAAEKGAWLFKKVDSVLRGNPRAEIEALLQATGKRRAVLLPANPSRGRTIRGGRYLIDGVPLDQSPFARDPEHPRTSADVQTLLGPSTGTVDPIVLPDVESEAELRTQVRARDEDTLASGAADFFAALLNERCAPAKTNPLVVQPQPPALLVCGSSAAWPSRESDCRAANVPVTTLDDPTLPPTTRVCLLGVGNSPAKSLQNDLMKRLADHAATTIQAFSVHTVLAEGGATAAALAERMNWSRFAVVAAAPAGVGVLRPLGQDNAPLFLIKPGSYPWPAGIWQSFLDCRQD